MTEGTEHRFIERGGPEWQPQWQWNDWHCACGWWGSHDWMGYAYHLEEQMAEAAAQAVAAERERLRGEPFRVLGFTLRELQAAIATADLYHPQWRALADPAEPEPSE